MTPIGKSGEHKAKRHVIPHYATRADYEEDASFRKLDVRGKMFVIYFIALAALWVSVMIAMLVNKAG